MDNLSKISTVKKDLVSRGIGNALTHGDIDKLLFCGFPINTVSLIGCDMYSGSFEELGEAIRYYTKEFFLDYFNNYLSISLIAEHNDITKDQADSLVSIGRKWHEEDVAVQESDTPTYLYDDMVNGL